MKIIILKIQIILTIIVVFSSGSLVSALSAEQKKVIDSGIGYFNVAKDATCSTSGSVTSGAKVLVIGDSVSEGLRDAGQVQAKFQAKGSQATVNAAQSRPLYGPGFGGGDGLTAIANDPTLKTASAIVIELGTNDPGNLAAHLPEAIDKIRSLNSQAKIYWVNLAPELTYSDANQVIHEQATPKNYQVIRWSDIADPFLQPGNVHPSPAGYQALADLLVSSVGSQTTAVVGSNTCCSATTLIGDDPAAKVYNFFISKGLKPFQAAGFLGNMQAEAHFEPRLVEYGFPNSRGEKSVQGQPSSLDDNIPPTVNDRGQPGYGIIQFTGGRKDGLQNFATEQGGQVNDLATQLGNVWRELNEGYKSSTLDPVLASTTVEEATDIILTHYEIPGNIPRERPGRTGAAQDFLIQFGSGTTSGGTSSGCGSGGGTANVGKYTSLSRPELVKLIEDNPVMVFGNWQNAGVQRSDIENGVTQQLLITIAAMLEQSGSKILVNALKSDHGPGSLHERGRAIDIGYWGNGQPQHNDEGDKLFKYLYDNYEALGIVELIWQDPPPGYQCIKNKPGDCYILYPSDIYDHFHHIHVGVK